MRAGIAVKQGRGLDDLFAVLAALAFEGLVCLALRILVKQEQFSEGVGRKMSFCIFLFVYHGGGQSLLRSLTLEYFFFYGTCGNEPIYEACTKATE